MTIEELHVGQKVRYEPFGGLAGHSENGIIKEIRATSPDAVWVVYNCDDNWNCYHDYTGAKTNLRDLKLGWKE